MPRESLLLLLIIPVLYYSFSDSEGVRKAHFTKIVIDSTFYSESVKAADLNQDGVLDIIAGDVWYPDILTSNKKGTHLFQQI
ncbi:MAG: hypothetical protein OEQ53_11895 [Saprospiraceae bacterium]|nr:hypothetical protein [Saprospiraceae bacterium]